MSEQRTLFTSSTDNRIHRSAEISECGRYRWWLRRSWQLWDEQGLHVTGKGVCCFVMLNPSTADALVDDPTIRRCIAFAKRLGYDTLSVRNLFPYRATDPKDMVAAQKSGIDICGGERGECELLSALTSDLVVAAWGSNVHWTSNVRVMEMFRAFAPEKKIYCLGTTKGGHPRHPLYVRADAELVEFGLSDEDNQS